MKLMPIVLLAAALAGCSTDERPADADVASVTGPAELFAVIDSLATPESMLHDPAQDVYFISNINGGGGARDGNGFISRVRADGTVEALRFIEGGRNGVTLHAPKGMAVRNGELWVTDLDALRSFDARTGAPRDSVVLAGAVFLNDLALGPDGALYASDSRLDFSAGDAPTDDRQYRIYRVANGEVSVVIADSALARPNGLTWSADGRLIIAPLSATHLLAWQPGTDTLTAFGSGPGGYDGIVELAAGSLLVSTINANQVGIVREQGFAVAIDSLTFPADIGYDRGRGRVLVPLLSENRAELWRLPGPASWQERP